MPVYQGIKLSVISQLELRIHPEFPHPESSQFTCRNLNTTGDTSSSLVSMSIASDSKADQILGRPSTISVYIPSHPGARFWLRYDVTEAKEPKAPWYYFKLFMNGRHMISWGTHSIFKPSGQVMRALYDPTPRWNYKLDETVYKNCGNEIRPFYFSNVKGRSPADDGGLIEVRVFRAKNRRRRMPSPAEFKPQDEYGLVLPSTGLTENPQDAKFYDWFLIDPTDSPFATFKFHYRSWDNLSSLHLIPTNHPRTLLFPSPSLLSLNGQSSKAHQKNDAAKLRGVERGSKCIESISNETSGAVGIGNSHKPKSNSFKPDFASSSRARTPLADITFDGASDASENADRRGALHLPRSPSPYYRNLTPVDLEALGFSAPPVPRLPAAAQPEWAEILNRPLPEIPRECRASQPLRHRSDSSETPSLTPSLREHYDRDTLSPSPILETATAVQFHWPPHPPKLLEVKRSSAKDQYLGASTDYPAPLAIPSKRQSGAIFSNITLRKHRNSSPPKRRPTVNKSMSDYDKRKQRGREESKSHDDETTPLSLTESEWMSNVPFSTRDTTKRKQMGQALGKDRDEYSDDIEEKALLREQAMDLYDSATVNMTELGETDSLEDYGEVRVPGGWV